MSKSIKKKERKLKGEKITFRKIILMFIIAFMFGVGGAIEILKRATSLDSKNQVAGRLDTVFKGKISKILSVRVPGVRFPY